MILKGQQPLPLLSLAMKVMMRYTEHKRKMLRLVSYIVSYNLGLSRWSPCVFV